MTADLLGAHLRAARRRAVHRPRPRRSRARRLRHPRGHPAHVAVRAPARRRPRPARRHPDDADGRGRRLRARAPPAPAGIERSDMTQKQGGGPAKGARRRAAPDARAPEDGAQRTASSQRWLERQLNDPYVAAAKRDGYPLARGLQADRDRRQAPPAEAGQPRRRPRRGAGRLEPDRGRARAVGRPARARWWPSTLCRWSRSPGVEVLQLDFMDEGAEARLKALLRDGRADVVLSDMAAPTHRPHAHRPSAHHGAGRGRRRVCLRRAARRAAPSSARCCRAAPSASCSTC